MQIHHILYDLSMTWTGGQKDDIYPWYYDLNKYKAEDDILWQYGLTGGSGGDICLISYSMFLISDSMTQGAERRMALICDSMT